MLPLQGFWSYVHSDDEAEQQRISRLARDVRAEFEIQTGESLELFLDKDELGWGENWREKIDETLASVAFFVPIITPRYFMSPECRKELRFFAERTDRLGFKDLVLPLVYVGFPAFWEKSPEDDLIELVKSFHWEDWRELRFAEVGAESYRRGVARLALRLVEANRTFEETDVAEMMIKAGDGLAEGGDDQPGFLDLVATAEEALPMLTETIHELGKEIGIIGESMEQATVEVRRSNRHSRGFSARLAIAQRLARKLVEPTDRVRSLGNDYASQLHEVDQGFRAIIESAGSEPLENPEARQQVCDFFQSVRSLAAAAHKGLASAREMMDAVEPVESVSRDLRPVLRHLRQGLATMIEAREVSDSWVHLINNTGLDCEPPAEAEAEAEAETEG